MGIELFSCRKLLFQSVFAIFQDTKACALVWTSCTPESSIVFLKVLQEGAHCWEMRFHGEADQPPPFGSCWGQQLRSRHILENFALNFSRSTGSKRFRISSSLCCEIRPLNIKRPNAHHTALFAEFWEPLSQSFCVAIEWNFKKMPTVLSIFTFMNAPSSCTGRCATWAHKTSAWRRGFGPCKEKPEALRGQLVAKTEPVNVACWIYPQIFFKRDSEQSLVLKCSEDLVWFHRDSFHWHMRPCLDIDS